MLKWPICQHMRKEAVGKCEKMTRLYFRVTSSLRLNTH